MRRYFGQHKGNIENSNMLKIDCLQVFRARKLNDLFEKNILDPDFSSKINEKHVFLSV